MSETITQIILAPSSLMYGYDGGTTQPIACLALVELADSDREVRAMGLTNCEIFEEQTGAVLFFGRSCEKRMDEVKGVVFEMRPIEWGITPSTEGRKLYHLSRLSAVCEFFKRKDRRCCNTKRPKRKRKVDPPLF